MINQNIEFIRSYFLSFDEEEQENIFSSLSDEQKDLIVEAGVVFLSNSGVETISENSYLIEHKRELKDIQLEYFIGLADILAAGGTNEVIEKLKDQIIYSLGKSWQNSWTIHYLRMIYWQELEVLKERN